MRRYVTYLRVSTDRQGSSGLGIEAQQRDINLYLERYSDQPFEVINSFTEVITGKDTGTIKEQREKAIQLARKERATLLVAKLDRLSRDVEDIASVIKRVDLKVACMPSADKFQLHLYAALAEQEREFISQRTKQALAAAKARGVKLGGLRDKTGKRNEALKHQADSHAEQLKGIVAPLVKAGYTTRQIASELNKAGLRSARGCEYQSMTVSRLIKRLRLQATN
ncbi:DNA-invertase hin [Microbulbifer aggregans]|uniref:DNA-invertase hin n=1 Tax=Microbulbifer aggregans TaxID=1769779 RepID=A0A1C9W4T9_9GAMM|nr:recombinase family protein [Microbulbifer aggregans]AOS96135.1 DNA-invertase hin [Microbulbifer aggregans]